MSTDQTTAPELELTPREDHAQSSRVTTLTSTAALDAVTAVKPDADLVPLPLPTFPGAEKVREFIQASKAEKTLRGYRADWGGFYAWSDSRGLCPLPASPDSVAGYIAQCTLHLKPGSIQRRLNAIAAQHLVLRLDRGFLQLRDLAAHRAPPAVSN
jgi:hypothetical protein